MLKLLKFLVVYILYWLLLYYAMYEHVAGAENLLMFVVWTTVLCALSLPSKAAIDRIAKEPKHAAIHLLNDTQAVATLLALVWSGWTVSGIAWAISMALLQYARIESDKIRKVRI